MMIKKFCLIVIFLGSFILKSQSNNEEYVLRPNLKFSPLGLLFGHFDGYIEFPINPKNTLEFHGGYFCLWQVLRESYILNAEPFLNKGPVYEFSFKHYFGNGILNLSKNYFGVSCFYKKRWFFNESFYSGSPGLSSSTEEVRSLEIDRFGIRVLIGSQGALKHSLQEVFFWAGISYSDGTRITHSSSSANYPYSLPNTKILSYFSINITLGFKFGLYL